MMGPGMFPDFGKVPWITLFVFALLGLAFTIIGAIWFVIWILSHLTWS